nr:MAG TPA: hypothetical protein [Caudoviricetes sp.]
MLFRVRFDIIKLFLISLDTGGYPLQPDTLLFLLCITL